jgi:uncharacterized protein YacL
VTTTETRSESYSPRDAVAGFLAVGSIILSAVGLGAGIILQIDARPVRTIGAAALVALVAARMSERYHAIALKALLFAAFAWVVGLTLAVITESPLL